MNEHVRTRPHALAGATILQLVPILRDDPAGRAAVETARTLIEAGARAILAGEGGPLVGRLDSFGAEWLPMAGGRWNPLQVRRNAARLGALIAAERVDILHAQCPIAAWSALQAVQDQPVFLVTSLPDRLPPNRWPGTLLSASLTRGDRVIAPSTYVAAAMIARYRIPPERITVIPRAVDTATFNPAAISADRIASVRRAWGLPPQIRTVLVAGRLAPWNGQADMVDAASLLLRTGGADVAFVFAGEGRPHARYAAALRRRAAAYGIDALCRFVGYCVDMPAALAAADVVVVPALQPPLTGRAAAEAQAVGRPVVTTAIGVLPENVLAPPRMGAELRTGWVVRSNRPDELAAALSEALALDATAAEALAARARQFAEFMFSPQSVAAAIRGVYTSLLSRDT